MQRRHQYSINRLKVYTDEQNETLDTTLRDVIAETVSSAIREAREDDNPKGRCDSSARTLTQYALAVVKVGLIRGK